VLGVALSAVGSAQAQRITVGVQAVSVSHLELQESDKSTGFGVGAVARVYLNRFTVEASGYRASLDSDQPSLLPFTMIDGFLSVLYEVTPGVALEVGGMRRWVDPEFSAQEIGAVSVGARGESRLASIATVEARAAYLIAPQFGSGGSAPFSIELGLGAAVGPAEGRWRARIGYDFQRLDRSVDGVPVPIQVTVAQLGIEFDF